MNSVVLGWAGVAAVGVLLSFWAVCDGWSAFASVRLAVKLKRAVAWGPRWWMALAFLVSDALFLGAWLAIATVGAIALTLPPPVSSQRQETSEIIGYVLLGMEADLAAIQIWWRVVRLKLRGLGAWVHRRESSERLLMNRASSDGRRMLHAINGNLQFAISALDAGDDLTPALRAALVARLRAVSVSTTDLQVIVRGLGPIETVATGPVDGTTP